MSDVSTQDKTTTDTPTRLTFKDVPFGKFFLLNTDGRAFYKPPREHFFANTETPHESVVIWEDDTGCLQTGTLFDNLEVQSIL